MEVKKVKEIWKDIEGYENLYQISDQGRVKSLQKIDSRGHLRNEKILNLTKSKQGYIQVNLWKNGKMKHFKVHRLVALAFIPNPDDGKNCIDHIDTNPSNNVVSNLRWCTQKENCNNPLSLQHLSEAMKGRVMSEEWRKKIGQIMTNGVKAKQVAQFSLNGTLIQIFPSAHEVNRKLGYSRGSICDCCRGKQKTAYKFIWKYI